MERAVPTVMRAGGLRVLFYSNEGDPREPPHVHVLEGRDEAKFWLTPEVLLAYNDGLKANVLNRAQRLVEENREALERAWHDYFA